MRFEMWDILANILLFLFWFSVWAPPGRQALFNPYVSPVERFSSRILDFVRPVLLGLPNRVIAVLAILFFITFRAVLFRSMATSLNSDWVIRFGTTGSLAYVQSFLSFLLFSALSFGLFLFKVWGLSLIYVRTRSGASSSNPEEALHLFSRPFTYLRHEIRPFVLLGFGVLLLIALYFSGIPDGKTSWYGGSGPVMAVKLIICTIAAWTDCLEILLSLVMVLIIGSWVSIFTSSFGIMMFCREWLDYFLGPMRKYPIRIGMIDLSPIVFFILVRLIYVLLRGILTGSYLAI